MFFMLIYRFKKIKNIGKHKKQTAKVQQEPESAEDQQPPTIEEIRISLKKLKGNTAPRMDNIPTELIKQETESWNNN